MNIVAKIVGIPFYLMFCVWYIFVGYYDGDFFELSHYTDRYWG